MSLDFLKTPLGADPIIASHRFKASRARLYKAWTDPKELAAWFGPAPMALKRVEMDLRVGGAFRFSFAESEAETNALCGEYLEIAPEERLVFTWRHEETGEDGALAVTPVSQVTVLFEPDGAGARLTVRHEGIRADGARRNVGGGWSAAFGHLCALLEEEPARLAE